MLSLRYYTDSRFRGGGPEMLRLSDAAAEREFALDPDSPAPVAELDAAPRRAGRSVKAHQQALDWFGAAQDNPNNHHVLSYVLRYGGSIDEAATRMTKWSLFLRQDRVGLMLNHLHGGEATTSEQWICPKGSQLRVVQGARGRSSFCARADSGGDQIAPANPSLGQLQNAVGLRTPRI